MTDQDALQNTLILLQYEFDKALLEGKSFAEVKIIYSQIKEMRNGIGLSQMSSTKRF